MCYNPRKTGQIPRTGELRNHRNLGDADNQQQRFDVLEAQGSFRERLKWHRRTLDLTQKDLAERAGCLIFALPKIKSGECRPSKQLAGLLVAALEIPEQEQPTFIQVARGDLILEHLRISKRDSARGAVSDLLALQETQGSTSAETDAERKILRRLSVFHGGFKRVAVEQVVDAAIPLLVSLASKSLTQHPEDGRYDLHEVIHPYALLPLSVSLFKVGNPGRRSIWRSAGLFPEKYEIFGEDIEGWDIACSLSYSGHATTSAGSFVEAKTIYRDAYVGCR